MISSDQFAFPDEEYLHHSIGFVLRHRDNVTVFHTAAGDFLLLGYFFYIFQQIPVFNGLFKIHGIGSIHHLLL